MDLPCPQWQDHVAQKWITLEAELKEKFTRMEEVDDVFKCALSLTTQADVDFMQSISAASSVQKDSDQAAECRQKGNSSFKIRDYATAALHYSQGICLAPQTSEQLSLCYANRSAALYHLQLYQGCLGDVDRALTSGYPSHLSHKLRDRRTACLTNLRVGAKAGEEDRHPAQRNHEAPDTVKAPSAHICPQVAVSSSVEKGRHLVAVDRIAAGEVILRERPYSCVLLAGVQEVTGKRGGAGRGVFGTESRRCHWCLAETPCPVPCGACSYGRYCSTGCRGEAWEEHHRWECLMGADLTVMGAMLQLALRVTLKAGMKAVRKAREPITDERNKSELNCQKPPSSDSYRSVFNLLHHVGQHSATMRFLCAVSVATVCLRLSAAGTFPTPWTPTGRPADSSAEEDGGRRPELWLLGSTVLRHMLQLRCNAQAVVVLQDSGAASSPVQPSREIRVASAIFPTLSLLNHSCRPNTSLAFSLGTDPCESETPAGPAAGFAGDQRPARGVTVTVRAARAVAPAQEILHCYGPHSSRMSTRERRRLLREQYFFQCGCEACSLQEEEECDEQRPGSGGSPHGCTLLCCRCQGSLKRSSDDGGSGFTCLRPSCGHRMSATDVRDKLRELRLHLERAVELLEREKPGEALALLEGTRRRSGLVLAETHPLRGELADATARAYATMGDWNNAASQLEKSVAAIGSQYGEDSVELAQQLFKLAQLHFNGAARGPALSLIPKVRRLLRLHLGPRCPELQELKAMEDLLRG